ncbi:penicillin-binding protein 1A [Hyphococcus sp. ECK-19]|uniref:Penicillin-binding protein 1A n=1 Tax=Hyphococcus lacteus TaxID=3143536 RepID=A0ABV3Z908_9PROT
MSDHKDDRPENKSREEFSRPVRGNRNKTEETSPDHSIVDDEEPIEHDMFHADDTPESDYDENEIVLGDLDEDYDEDVVLSEDDEAKAPPLAAPLAATKRSAATTAPPKKKRKKTGSNDGGGAIGVVLRLIGLALAIGALGVIGVAGFSAWYLNKLNQDLPDYQALANYAPPVTTRVYAGDGSLVAEFARERRLFVPIESMPDHVKYAFVSAEDKTFYDHGGIDLRGITRAQLSNISNVLRGRRLEGGSTITQQVAKNFLLTSEQKVERKLREMLIARKMERTYTKDHILELYLNEIYLGNRSYGVAAAALNYFDKSLGDLTIAEASYLAAITKGPSNYHPINNEARAVERRNWVIGRLLDDGRISAEDAAEAQAQPLGAQIAPPLGARDWTMEYFAEEVRKQIVELYGVEALYDGGLSVRTSVDPNLQKKAGDALRRWLVKYDQRHGWRGPISTLDIDENWPEVFTEEIDDLRNARKVSDDMAPWRPALVLATSKETAKIGFPDGAEATIPLEQLTWARQYISANDLGEEITSVAAVLNKGDVVYVERIEEGVEVYGLRQAPAVNGGLIAIDPHTGRVVAMVGGFSFQLSEFNRAVQAERQPGSTFKPFVYSVALDSGYTPASIVLDAPFVAPSLDSWYKPGNYIAGRYYGESTLRLGIEQSRNAMTARLAQDLGIGRIIDYVSKFNLSDSLPRELAISLGAGETTLMRITAGYSVFVNGGKSVDPVFIDRIQDRTGKTIYKRDTRSCPSCNADYWSGQLEPQLPETRKQVIDPRTAYQVTSLLEGVVIRGTGSAVRRATNKPLAGKTGTTNDYKDAWFVGFSPDLAAGVYVGFDMPQTLGQGEAGGTVAAPVFADFMVEALKDEAGIPFRVPSGVRLVRVNAKTGRPATGGDRNVILEAFKADDVIGADPTRDELSLDPLSAAPRSDTPKDELNGLY